VVNKDEVWVFKDGNKVLVLFNDESNEPGDGSNVLVVLDDESNELVVGNFTEENNDVEEELKRFDVVGVFKELLGNLDDASSVDGLLVVCPDNNELVVFTVDVDDKRLGFCCNELILLGVIVDFDRSEFVVDNNEDAVDGFLESAIFLLAQYCIESKQIYKEMKDRKTKHAEVFKGNLLLQSQCCTRQTKDKH
jgi:hypothetical protein